MIDFSENKESNFCKAGRCFIKTFVFLSLGIAETVKRLWSKLTKRGLLIISSIWLDTISMCWLFNYMHMKVRLTTVEWQRDSLKMQLDSINELHGKTAEYSRFE